MEIKFVNYTGASTSLCSGILTLEIDGKLCYFGEHGEEGLNYFASFWESGGSCWIDGNGEDHVVRRKWKLKKEALPDFLKPYGKQLIAIFNKNVPRGCCGGCI